MPEPKTGAVIIKCPDSARAADLALLVREELEAREQVPSISVRHQPGLEPDALEAAVVRMGEEGPRTEQALNLAGQTPEQCLMAILGLLEESGLLTDQAGYSSRDEEQIKRHLEELGYL